MFWYENHYRSYLGILMSHLPSAKAQIRNLLVVIGAAIITSLLMTAWMVRSYGPTGTYSLKNVLLAPQTMFAMTSSPLVFDHIEYAAWDFSTHRWNRKTETIEEYQSLFAKLENRQNEPSIAQAEEAFSRQDPTILTILVRFQNASLQTFQKIQLVSDYVRVELHADQLNEKSKWVYFYYSPIHKLATSIFDKSSI
ncbi:MAG: hypothetical protein ACXU9U_02905 [Parachlamydiaceae bacterium]